LPTLGATATAATAPANPGLYGFCFERRQSAATSYVSGTFEIPRDNVEAEMRVMFGEFAKDTAHRYGVVVAALDGNNSCTYQLDAPKADAYRKQIVAEYAKHGAVVETGWKFDPTAPRPPPETPRGGGH
jgi:hypothetical protein